MTSTLQPYVLVFASGGIGSVLRLGVFHASRLWLPPDFPFGTLIVNVFGSLAVGLAAGWMIARSAGEADPLAFFLITGLLGGFTTFSAFSLDAFLLWQNGHSPAAATYVLGSILLSIGAVVAGLGLARTLL